MSSTILSSSTTTVAGSHGVAQAIENSPPIVHLLHFLLRAANVTWSVVVATFHALFSISSVFLNIFHTLSTPILYLLSPFLLFAQIVLDGLVYTPYRILAYLVYSLYPIYVLVGTACIAAGVLGMTARFVTHIVKSILLDPSTPPPFETSTPRQPPESPSPPSSQNAIHPKQEFATGSSRKRKTPKRVSIKEETFDD
ncbi:hypothetical protein K474DRAFT_170000 [Panus rudis PR-1116 ss-1]|nr:hypothetical protein K474DRAFT_170000 [Panus rudis PR-1116 ss-1]